MQCPPFWDVSDREVLAARLFVCFPRENSSYLGLMPTAGSLRFRLVVAGMLLQTLTWSAYRPYRRPTREYDSTIVFMSCSASMLRKESLPEEPWAGKIELQRRAEVSFGAMRNTVLMPIEACRRQSALCWLVEQLALVLLAACLLFCQHRLTFPHLSLVSLCAVGQRGRRRLYSRHRMW